MEVEANNETKMPEQTKNVTMNDIMEFLEKMENKMEDTNKELKDTNKKIEDTKQEINDNKKRKIPRRTYVRKWLI